MSKREKFNRADAFRTILSGTTATAPVGGSEMVALDEIRVRPDQPRRYFDQERIDQLATSIREKGLLQPVLLRRYGNEYELVAGERRYRAAQQVGLEAIPALVVEIPDENVAEIALVENLNREDLNPVEETDAVLNLLSAKLGKSVGDIIGTIRSIYDQERGRLGNTGVSTEDETEVRNIFKVTGRLTVSSFCTHRLPLLSLPKSLLDAVRSGKLEYTKAKLLARISNEDTRTAILTRVIEEGLSRESLRQELFNPASSPVRAKEERAVDVNSIKRKLTAQRIEKLPKRKRQRLDKLLIQVEELLTE